METQLIRSICRRHRIPRKYVTDFCLMIQSGRIESRTFSRRLRRQIAFKACLEEMLDLLSEPWSYLFEPSEFESLELVS